MRYLILATPAAAEARARDAYAGVRGGDTPPADLTDALWTVIAHPQDGRAALRIPRTPGGAGLGLGQGEYEALLTPQETGALVGALDAGWFAPAG